MLTDIFTIPYSSPAIVLSPVTLGFAALILLMFFAPRLLPPVMHLLGRIAGIELRRRAGLPPRAGRSVPRSPEPPAIEILPPEHPQPTRRSSNPVLLSQPEKSRTPFPAWGVALVVFGAVAVLLWYLLHPR